MPKTKDAHDEMTIVLTEEQAERIHAERERFARDFRTLVRKYVPDYPWRDAAELFRNPGVNPIRDAEAAALLHALGETTSVFAPYIWSDR